MRTSSETNFHQKSALLELGYDILLVNYVGSIGYGQESVYKQKPCPSNEKQRNKKDPCFVGNV